ncbi:hypothetical protein BDW22DRAFT_1481897 [Trametopsis cervina]|nr:hypothetical protein BDW22DRAFT_1481897 [Trametopsis cervina]
MTYYEMAPCAVKLPPELLERIFQLHAAACREPWISDTDVASACWWPESPYAWIFVTHVCRYWRDVALDSALLWSYIMLTRNLECVEAFLTRSQKAPLTVTQPRGRGCFGERGMPVASMRLVLAEMGRIRALELYMKWWIFDDVAGMLSKPSANLKSLKLSTPHGICDSGFVQPVVYLNHGSDGPSLENLTLCAYGFPWWNPAPYKGLLSLRIVRGIPEKPSVGQVIRALQIMPHLRHLCLCDVFTPSPKHLTSLPVIEEVAILQQLETLELSGDIVACSALLSSLIIPATAHISLDYRRSRSADLPLAMLPVYSKFTGIPSVGCEDMLQSVPGSPVHVEIERDPSSYIVTFHSPYEHDHSEKALTVSIGVSAEITNLQTICRDIPLDSLKVLSMSSILDWKEIASYLGTVEELRVQKWPMRAIADLILYGCDGFHADEIGAGCAVAFPALRSLKVKAATIVTETMSDPLDGKNELLDAVTSRNWCSSSTKLEEVSFEL